MQSNNIRQIVADRLGEKEVSLIEKRFGIKFGDPSIDNRRRGKESLCVYTVDDEPTICVFSDGRRFKLGELVIKTHLEMLNYPYIFSKGQVIISLTDEGADNIERVIGDVESLGSKITNSCPLKAELICRMKRFSLDQIRAIKGVEYAKYTDAYGSYPIGIEIKYGYF